MFAGREFHSLTMVGKKLLPNMFAEYLICKTGRYIRTIVVLLLNHEQGCSEKSHLSLGGDFLCRLWSVSYRSSRITRVLLSWSSLSSVDWLAGRIDPLMICAPAADL